MDPNIIDRIEAAPFVHPAEFIDGQEDEDDDGMLDLSEIGSIPAEALSAFLRFVIPAAGKSKDRTRWETAALRVAVLAHTLLPEIRKIPEHVLAEELGVSRSGVSKAVGALRDFARLDCRAGRTETARAIYRERARAAWNRKKAEAPPTPNAH